MYIKYVSNPKLEYPEIYTFKITFTRSEYAELIPQLVRVYLYDELVQTCSNGFNVESAPDSVFEINVVNPEISENIDIFENKQLAFSRSINLPRIQRLRNDIEYYIENGVYHNAFSEIDWKGYFADKRSEEAGESEKIVSSYSSGFSKGTTRRRKSGRGIWKGWRWGWGRASIC